MIASIVCCCVQASPLNQTPRIPSPATSIHNTVPDYAIARHGDDILMGQPAELCRLARPQSYRGGVDERPHHFKRRSCSAWAKRVLASFKISLASRSSLFSRSSALIPLHGGSIFSRVGASTNPGAIHRDNGCHYWARNALAKHKQRTAC